MKVRIFLFKFLNVAVWPVWARRVFVLAALPRKRLDDLPFTIKFGKYLYSGNATNLIDYHMLSRGAFEPGLAQLLQDWANLHPESIFLDVGANLGVHTLAVAPLVKRIIAVEPFPPVADRLEATLSANKISNVSVTRAALSNQHGTVSFKAPDSSNLGMGRVVAGDGSGNLLQVPQVTGDELLEAESLPLGLVKIDVEGLELAVLEGLQNRIEKDRPLIVFEVLNSDQSAHQAIREFLPRNYSFFRLKNARRRKYEVEPWGVESGDIVALPGDGADFLRTHSS